jgi:hypothetical protein
LFQKIRNAYRELLATITVLTGSINENSKLTRELIALTAAQASAAERTAESTRFLAAAEKHRRESAGQPHSL